MESPLSEDHDNYSPYGYEQTPLYTVHVGNVMHQRMALILVAVVAMVAMGIFLNQKNDTTPLAAGGGGEVVAALEGQTAVSSQLPTSSGAISPAFAAPIQHWAPQIVAWAAQQNLDPNIVATIMQIESCGDPQAVSSAGAQGLFQVMPGHFEPGEVMVDPDTNAMRGLNYYNVGLQYHNGDKFLSFAGYNGGHGTVAREYSSWPNETKRYYYWAKGIYEEIQTSDSSATLQEWLNAGGSGLCQQAASRLGI
jgi:hypothetical protein